MEMGMIRDLQRAYDHYSFSSRSFPIFHGEECITGGLTDKLTDGRTDGLTKGWTDKRTDQPTDRQSFI